MRNYIIAIVSAVLAATPVQASPEVVPDVAVMSFPTKEGTVTIGDIVFFTRTFDVSVVNGGDGPLDLSKGCYVLTDSDGTRYDVDTIDEKMFSTKLGAGESVKSFIQFSGESENVHEASIVRFLTSCSTE